MAAEQRLYVDERYLDLDGVRHVLLGALVGPDRACVALGGEVARIAARHGLPGELRFAKVALRGLEGYRACIDAFFHAADARFVVLHVNRASEPWRSFAAAQRATRRSDHLKAAILGELLRLALAPIGRQAPVHIVADAGYFTDESALERTVRAVASSAVVISRDSHAEILIQLVDLLLGALSYAILETVPASAAKRALVEHLVARRARQPTSASGLPKVMIAGWSRWR